MSHLWNENVIRLNCSLINVLLIISSLYLFTSINLLLFYLFYEFGLLLIFYLIVNWGYGENLIDYQDFT